MNSAGGRLNRELEPLIRACLDRHPDRPGADFTEGCNVNNIRGQGRKPRERLKSCGHRSGSFDDEVALRPLSDAPRNNSKEAPTRHCRSCLSSNSFAPSLLRNGGHGARSLHSTLARRRRDHCFSSRLIGSGSSAIFTPMVCAQRAQARAWRQGRGRRRRSCAACACAPHCERERAGVHCHYEPPARAWGVNKVITRAAESGRHETGSMAVRNRRFAAGFPVTPRRAETVDRRF
jgi:hypothetical protein